ncbi:MAG: oligopeptide/dipeptide ABC transporter ATP-binding protein, partial [Bacilli bacterium]
VSFRIPDGGSISFIGESGCGKTTVGRILAGLETPTAGNVRLDGTDIHQASPREQRGLRRKIQLIHQDPYQALNPAHSIEQALSAPLQIMARQKPGGAPREWIRERMDEVLTMVGLEPASVLYKHPHMLSGGQRQRIVIARALTVEPTVLVADEAVSMIDVSLRLGVLHLLRDLREKLRISLLFITHDVAAARYLGQDGQMSVIYKGLIMEQGSTEVVIAHPQHPYTQALLSAVPVLKGLETMGADRFILAKEMNAQSDVEAGCLFADRCPFAQAMCFTEAPTLSGGDHQCACHFPEVRQVAAVAAE